MCIRAVMGPPLSLFSYAATCRLPRVMAYFWGECWMTEMGVVWSAGGGGGGKGEVGDREASRLLYSCWNLGPTFGTLTLWSNSRPPLTYHYGSLRSKPSELRCYRGSGWMRGAVHNEMLMRWVEMHPSCPRARDTLVPVARAVY